MSYSYLIEEAWQGRCMRPVDDVIAVLFNEVGKGSDVIYV